MSAPLHVNISALFREVPFLERPAAAAAAGFDAVECWWPFAGPVPGDDELQAFTGALRAAGVRLAALNLDGGDLAAGERGLLSDPQREGEFRANLEAAAALAGELGCTVLNALHGNRRLGLDPVEQDRVAVEHLAAAAAAAAEVGATVVVEALNPWENPLYPLTTAEQVVGLLDRVRCAAGADVRLLLDLYHLQRTQGELIPTARRHVRRIGHVQVADAPGRGEPGTGEIAVPRVLAALDAAGYDGPVALEYLPTTTTRASLAALVAARFPGLPDRVEGAIAVGVGGVGGAADAAGAPAAGGGS